MIKDEIKKTDFDNVDVISEENIKSQISEKYNLAINNYDKSNPQSSIEKMNNIINKKDSTYSPLALYFLLDKEFLHPDFF